MADFTHLHLHTAYSFLSGAIHMKEVVPRIKELGMDAVAVTDTGNMFGAVTFYRQAKAAGVKPILGSELWVTPGSRLNHEEATEDHQLVLLAKDAAGYQNLMHLVSMGWREGFLGHPRVDKALIQEHSEGIIALSGALGGELPGLCAAGDMDAARAVAEFYQGVFQPGHYFLELVETGRPEQDKANAALKQLAADLKLPLVAANDCHYVNREDAAAHDVLSAIQVGKSKNDPTRPRRNTDALYIRSPQEMMSLFRDCPEAIENTQRISEMVNLELKLGKPELPNFVPEDGSDLVTHLRDRSEQGLAQRLKELPYEVDEGVYRARLEEELGIIISMKFPGYFLIVADFINWAKENDIPVGPGRGSGAGSIVAYALRITDIDPIPYNLLFERFLNPERVSMPDFDVDFCQERRGEVIEYVTRKYGDTRVGQIATYAQMKAKSVIKDVARALELPFSEVNELTKLLPATYKNEKGSVKAITIDKAIELEPKLRQLMEENATYQEVITIARKLENLYRQAGMHAAGVVIGNKDLWEIVPVFKGNDGELVTQFNMVDVEDAGLVKFDFLGLKTLDVIYHAELHANARLKRELEAGEVDKLWAHHHIQQRVKTKEALAEAVENMTAYVDRRRPRPEGVDLSLRISLLPLEDPAVYQLIGRGETLGVFQLESTGFQELLKRLKPDCFEDIVAAVALYRPGPLQTGMVEDFVDCKQGRKEVRYPHPSLEEILKPTYGGFVYQEQVMQAAQKMANYSLGGADLLRRAMGKKKAEVMAKERVKFVAGCTENQIPESQATSVFDLMEKFAGYGFNKSHSAAYALVTFQTAYLKNYYPVEFMAALLSTEAGSTDNVVKYIAEARSMKIEVLPPTVNDSGKSFSVPGGCIRFGLGAIKGLGDAALEAIVHAREEGAFDSLYDFCERVSLKQLNKKTLETLVRSGAFDCFERPRAQLMASLDGAIDAARSVQRAEAQGQSSLFGGSAELAASVKPREVYPECGEWPELTRLKLEKEAIGFYLTGHPVSRYAEELAALGAGTIASMYGRGPRFELTVGCVVTALRERPLKDGSGRMAFVTIEDLSGQVELMAPARAFGEHEAALKSGAPLVMTLSGSLDQQEGEEPRLRVRMKSAQTISEARQVRTRMVFLRVLAEGFDPDKAARLKAILRDCAGPCPVSAVVRVEGAADVVMELGPSWKVAASDELLDGLEQLMGAGSVRFRGAARAPSAA